MRPSTLRPAFVLLVIAQLTFFGYTQSRRDILANPRTKLEKGISTEARAEGGEAHQYYIVLESGQFAGVIVDQRGIDLVVRVTAPDGRTLAEIDSPNGTYGPERVSIVAKTAGRYVLEIRALESAAEPGDYQVRIAEVRPASRMDKIQDLAARIVAAEGEEESDSILQAEIELAGVDLGRAMLVEGLRLRNTSLPRERLLVVFKRLLRFTESSRMRSAAGMAYRGVGLAYSDLNELALAEEHFLKTIALFESFGEGARQGLAWTTRDLANVYARRSQLQKAIELYERSRQLSSQVGDFESVVQTSNALAVQYLFRKDFAKVEEILEASIKLSSTLENKSLRTGTLQHAGSIYASQGRLAKALEAFQAALQVAEDIGHVGWAVQNLYNVAKMQERLGNVQEAYINYQRVVTLAPTSGDRSRKINANLNLASIHERYGDQNGAVSRLRSILEYIEIQIARERGGVRRSFIADKAGVLNTLAKISLSQGNANAAFDLHTQGLKMFEAEGLKPKEGTRVFWELGPEFYFAREIATHRALADLHSSRGAYSQAEIHYARALNIAETAGYGQGIVETLFSMSINATKQGSDTAALAFANRARDVGESAGRSDYSLLLKSLVGGILRKMNKVAEAKQMYLEAIKISESLRTDATAPAFRSSYFSSLLSPYDDYIDLLMDQSRNDATKNQDRTALDLSERRRARSLLDSLKEARADIRRGVDANLIEQENRILNQLYDAAGTQGPILNTPKVFQTADDLPLFLPNTSANDVATLTSDLRRIETEIRKQSPRYAALTQPQPLTADEIQGRVVDEDTVMLNYALGERRSFLWIVSKTSLRTIVLPPRAEIESSAKKVYSLLSSPPVADAAEWERESGKLSETLLAPAIDVIDKKRIVIVADGSLQYIPFSSLPDPRVRGSIKPPMLSSNEIVYIPSASVLDVLRRDHVDIPTPAASVAVFGDPVFAENDERLSGVTPKGKATNAVITRALLIPQLRSEEEPRDAFGIPRLPFSRREAESIFESALPSVSLKALDFVATRERAISGELAKYRIVHFATHGILHSQHPELSGIVLSLVNEKGEPVNGFLRLNDIYNMKLNADLVVLSACQTALGKEVRGEGLIGLTRGFMYAGSPRVVASLWKVDDVATAELMKIFYQKMLKERMRPAAALRAAKMAMMNQKRWNAPYYWAAFELQGEWR
jgi:CHAT domain-containing protein